MPFRQWCSRNQKKKGFQEQFTGSSAIERCRLRINSGILKVIDNPDEIFS
jgi:hypothetical protein